LFGNADFVVYRYRKFRPKSLICKDIMEGGWGYLRGVIAIFVVFEYLSATRRTARGVLGDPTAGAYNGRAGCPGMLRA
jgi:hypothetical protein